MNKVSLDEYCFENLSFKQLDLLKELATIGAGHATTALYQMIGHKIYLEVPRVNVIPISEVPDAIGGAERLVMGLFLKIYGDATGSILILFPIESASSLLCMLLGDKKYDSLAILNEREISALKELGNILSASYLNAIARLLNIVIIPSVPGFSCDMAGAVIDYILIELGKIGNVALLIETLFSSAESNIKGHFFLLPDPSSMKVFLKAIQ